MERACHLAKLDLLQELLGRLRHDVSWNHDLIETYLADRSEEKKAYWLRGPPAGRGVELSADQIAAHLAY
jgi:hypothetical protein